MLGRLNAGIEPAGPTPLIGIDRNASPLPDRADLNIAVADAPNFLA
jgi:hypothetical protein